MRALLQRFEAFALRPGFGDGVMLALCATIVVLAAVMQPSTETLTLFGWDVPVMCTLRRLTGLSCPGCGLTRSFVFLAHGQIVEAFRMNVFGPIAFAWVLGQLPWRARRIWRANRG